MLDSQLNLLSSLRPNPNSLIGSTMEVDAGSYILSQVGPPPPDIIYNKGEELGSISGYKWDDINGNGKWDEDDGETGLENWKIYIDENENGQLDRGEPFMSTEPRG